MKKRFATIAMLFTVFYQAQNFTAVNLAVSLVGDVSPALSSSTAAVT